MRFYFLDAKTDDLREVLETEDPYKKDGSFLKVFTDHIKRNLENGHTILITVTNKFPSILS